MDRLENTPAKALLEPNEVFERLEEVKRSPMRVQLVCRDLVKEAEEMEEQEEKPQQQEDDEKKAMKTPARAKTPKRPKEMPADVTSKRMTRSTKKGTPAPFKSECGHSQWG